MSGHAAIDCGTNSTRLLAVDDNGIVVARELIVTRLGQGVDATGHLAPEAIDRTVSALSKYRAILDGLGIDHVKAFATSAARDSANADVFMEAATAAAGVAPIVLSGEEEGLVTFTGATVGLPAGSYLVIDIGGGSTELVWSDGGPPVAVSMDVGCVRLTERHLHSESYASHELQGLLDTTEQWLIRAAVELPAAVSTAQLVGVAGTITTVAAMDLHIDQFDPEVIHHHRLYRETVEGIFSVISRQSHAERIAMWSIPIDRADVIVAGIAILLATMRHFGFEDCLVSVTDNLDGTIAEMQKPS